MEMEHWIFQLKNSSSAPKGELCFLISSIGKWKILYRKISYSVWIACPDKNRFWVFVCDNLGLYLKARRPLYPILCNENLDLCLEAHFGKLISQRHLNHSSFFACCFFSGISFSTMWLNNNANAKEEEGNPKGKDEMKSKTGSMGMSEKTSHWFWWVSMQLPKKTDVQEAVMKATGSCWNNVTWDTRRWSKGKEIGGSALSFSLH